MNIMRGTALNIITTLVYLLVAITLFSCTKPAAKSSIVEVESIEITDDEIELTVGESYFVDAKINPDEAAGQTIEYSSTNESVATIDNFADIQAVGEGECAIRLKSANGTTVEIQVTVQEKKVEYIIGKWKGKKIYYIQNSNRIEAKDLLEDWEVVKSDETPEEKRIREGNIAGLNNNINIFVKQWHADLKANHKGTVTYLNKIEGDEDRSFYAFADWELNDDKTYNLHYTVNDPKLSEDQKKDDANEIYAILTLNPNNKKIASFIFTLNRDPLIELEVQIEKEEDEPTSSQKK